MDLDLFGPGHVWVTDIAAGNAETLFTGKTRTLAALIDLANLCQAAIMQRHLGLPPEKLAYPQIAMSFCFARIESQYNPSVMDGTAGVTIDDTFLAAKDLWPQMARDERACNAWLTGSVD